MATVVPQFIPRTRSRRQVDNGARCCVLCFAELNGNHAEGDLCCDNHPRTGYSPRHDPRIDERIVLLLWRANGHTLNLCRALGAAPKQTNIDAIADSVARVNRHGCLHIVGKRGWGYKLERIRA